ncbi:CBS domain-containing protein [Solitalea canadensis]|uniref:Putative transcriptional regulator, contains C-terminal CBS domains n=1 Tax=Solitalea canadensis (strain ATCC 29591 / DSM 3403 / JCM 21819 / LMG 8368 / NBRC 15130 / NCIMB 12057 / USAM 9D) TaxID=929556 RepID=H8KP51_SOLCM|nr:CBS domain-containing protein [Solitalea canadensis]AFD05688.1 putative transcriptional regulator, contains C-terminal CBS domains [Solitalea canadensis DSM 3403]
MVASQLASDFIPPLKTSDSAQKALDRMAEFRVSHLPIVNETEFLGLISDHDIAELADLNEPIGSSGLSIIYQSVNEDQHLYDAIRLIHEQKLTVVPVIDHRNQYTGLITLTSLAEYFSVITAIESPGGIIILELGVRDFSLSEIARLIESDNAMVLSSYVKTFSDSTKLELTIKVNKTDLTSILASFQRFGYTVKASFSHVSRSDDTMDRFDSFMHYLNM